jgi:hypothetical protein
MPKPKKKKKKKTQKKKKKKKKTQIFLDYFSTDLYGVKLVI